MAVALHVTPEEVWRMDTADLFTVLDVLTPPKRDDVIDWLAD